MKSKLALNLEFQLLGTLKTLAEAYEQISVIRIQRVRGSVINTRDFLEGLAEIFNDVKQSYRDQVQELLKRHKKNAPGGIKKNGKTMAILIASNNKLYGDIVFRVFNLFMKDVEKNNYDVAIIGKVGKVMYELRYPGKEFLYFDIPDQNARLSDIMPVIEKIVGYSRILVYYGHFLNIVTQEPAISEVLGDSSLLETTGQEVQEKHKMFYFEPSLQEILEFFEAQMFSSVMKQIVDESELSRLASRIKSMEDSLGTIEKDEQQLRKSEIRTKRLLENSKQIQRLSGAVWSQRQYNSFSHIRLWKQKAQ
ncbi:MAG: F0F1 ATP synthase subunit gamma [Candidatus Levyibacteriota bacterium]